MPLMSAALAAFTFALVFALIFGAYWLLVARPEAAAQAKVVGRLGRAQSAPGAFQRTLQKEAERLSAISGLQRLLEHLHFIVVPIETAVTQSGLHVTVGVVMLAGAVLFMSSFFYVTRVSQSALAGLAAASLMAYVPLGYVHHVRRKRMLNFEEHFPQAMALIARAIRAGHAFTTSIKLVGEEIVDPVGAEFRTLYERQNYGLPLDDALREMAARVPLIDARFFATAVLTQRETGGNLAEVLDHLADVIRDRFRIRRQVRVMSAHGRTSGYVISAMPPVLAAVMAFVDPDQLRILVNDPLGVRLIVGAVVMQVAGTLVIRRLVDIRY